MLSELITIYIFCKEEALDNGELASPRCVC